jgi:hypothetical protein
MGVALAPVAGSGFWPACSAKESNFKVGGLAISTPAGCYNFNGIQILWSTILEIGNKCD